ncbi:hypothetical protein M0805_009194 [Coniferiporia weirii]|nr:hypothetical protein M0805_009194 [Coniferiporia weirii]
MTRGTPHASEHLTETCHAVAGLDLEEEVTAEAKEEERERRLKGAVRRFYALGELIETERGYVNDLKVLVEVYLTSLGALPTYEACISDSPIENVPGPSSPRSRRDAHIRSYQYPPSAFPVPSPEPRAAEIKVRPTPTHVQQRSGTWAGQDADRRDAERRSGSIEWERGVRSSLDGTMEREVKMRNEQGHQLGLGHARMHSVGTVALGSAGASQSHGRRASSDSYQRFPAGDHLPSATSAFGTTSVSPSSLHPLPLNPPLSPTLRAALTDIERRGLARGAAEILTLHERIVRRIEEALLPIQSSQGRNLSHVQINRGRGSEGMDGGREKKQVKDERERVEVEAEVEQAAPNFAPYNSFCAGHTEALDTVRREMRIHTSEWMEWEKRCAEVAVQVAMRGPHDSGLSVKQTTQSPRTPAQAQTEAQARLVARCTGRDGLLSTLASSTGGSVGDSRDVDDARSSTSTLRRRHSASESTGSLRASASTTLKHTKSDPTPPTASAHGHGYGGGYSALSVKRLSRGPLAIVTDKAGVASGSEDTGAGRALEQERERERSARMRLSFTDYLIKPVQRVCKYPLLFEQLRAPGKREQDGPVSPISPVDDFVLVPRPSSSVELPRRKSGQAEFSFGGDSDSDDDGEDEDVVDEGKAGTCGKGPEDADSTIERALRAMRGVAHDVDEARRRRELENKSRLIADRLISGIRGGDGRSAVPGLGDDAQGSVEDGRVESHSELGHASISETMRPPTRSLSFSSAFSRSRSRSGFSRTGSLVHQTEQWGGGLGSVNPVTGRLQVPGPPSRAFLASLGACLLAGSLDVVVGNIDRTTKVTRREGGRSDSVQSRPVSHILSGGMSMGMNNGLATSSTFISASSREPVKVKYLAAFLYVGGYVILAKTPKAGVYEARHWFSLADETIEIVDVREREALLPCSFHLIFHSTGHRLELAAACQREKELWLNAAHHARAMPCVWDFEPVPTLNVSANLVSTRTRDSIDVPSVPSVPSMANDIHPLRAYPSHKASTSTLKTDAALKTGRRQSLTGSSVRAFFLNGADAMLAAPPPTLLIRRVSATRRAQTDRYLADVLSQPLLAARLHAKSHDEVLFRDPNPPQQGAGIGVGTIAKNKLMARDSVLVTKQCAPSVCASLAGSDRRSIISDSPSSITVQKQGMLPPVPPGKANKKTQRRLSLGMRLTLPSPLANMNAKDSRTSTSSRGAFSPDSPMPSTSTSHSLDPLSRSLCSSATASAVAHSPVNDLFPPEVRVVGVDSPPRTADELPGMVDPLDRPKRSRSFVRNFKGIFGVPRSFSPSPATSSSSSRQASTERMLNVPDEESGHHGNVLARMWRNRPSHQRAHSTIDMVGDMQISSSTLGLPLHSESLAARPRGSLLSRSSSLFVMNHRKTDRSVAEMIGTPQQYPESSSVRQTTRRSRHTLGPSETRQESLRRSIKYRLFPGSLVPLTPMEVARERRRL